ncbi:hypothetical protein PSTG_17622 [Puccinia striiformis f. sp. tritici PST-78]|uniref:Uncharacterized protein n=1 Tax=Puccinia striiformis f. sp. tritici PST-78 TaxID=1165861 RepID=A0A0L0UPJ0_9BASI|nr:hypothetical protein PSTG_17622 [Puccinia striiformis f. sp. tritici PST-78]
MPALDLLWNNSPATLVIFQVFPRVQALFPVPRCQVTAKNNGQRVETASQDTGHMQADKWNSESGQETIKQHQGERTYGQSHQQLRIALVLLNSQPCDEAS